MIDLKILQTLTKIMTALYVEDEDNIRIEVKKYFDRLFAHVDSAENGQVGLQKYKNGRL